MSLSPNKTKVVCTIGPASMEPEVMQAMIDAGMNVARLNFSHGDFKTHGEVIARLRAAARATGREVAIMADLPGPKMRIGQLSEEPLELKPGQDFTLTTEEVVGDCTRAGVTFKALPEIVKAGTILYLNDGLIQLEVKESEPPEVCCRVVVGGELRSRKGLNLPGIDLGMSAFTSHDRECLRFALEAGVDAVSQSFVDSAADVHAVRQAARALDHDPFIIAKIERSRALDHLDEILDASDGIMIARGDLGVEVPVERIAILQKDLTRRALRLGKPVVTATQMLESMTHSPQPTRAEATDVANAILDGTDCVMLSGESAMGRYPVEAVRTLVRIAAATEPYRPRRQLSELLDPNRPRREFGVRDLISASVETFLELGTITAVVVPTRSGSTARSIARFRLPVWLAAASANRATCRHLQFSYGVHPVHHSNENEDWDDFARSWIRDRRLMGRIALLVQGPSPQHPDANQRIEVIELAD